MTIKTESNKQMKGSTHIQWLVAILANTTLFNYGLQCGWIACMARVLQSEQSPIGSPLTDNEISWVASAPSLAAVFCVSVYTYLVDEYGRKKCIVMIAVFQALCWLIKLFTANTIFLIIARISVGIAGGGCFNTVPMYVKEISQDNLRGTLGMILIMAQNFGILVMYAMGGYLGYYTVLWIVVAIPIVNTLLMLKAPESPSFLVKVGRLDDAASTIALLRGLNVDDKAIQNEIDAIKAENEKFKSMPDISFVTIFKQKAWRKGFIFMILLMICHGMNGGFSIVNYAATILIKSGVTISPELQSLSIPVFMVLGSLVSMVCVERLGRKPILSTCFIAAVISFSALSAVLLIQRSSACVPGWVPILLIVIPVCSYAAGVSPLPFVIMSEMFTFQIRAKIMGVLVTLGWAFSFIQLVTFAPITNTYGPHVSFLSFAVINLCGAFVTLVLLPETKGKSVKQIELELEKRSDKK